MASSPDQEQRHPRCAECLESFSWDDAYRATDTPGSRFHNPLGGTYRPRAYCPNCGALVAELVETEGGGSWSWAGQNASVNFGAELCQGSGLLNGWSWGKDIPAQLLPLWTEGRLDVESVRRREQSVTAPDPPSSEAAEQAAQQGYRLLHEDRIDEAVPVLERARELGQSDHDRACALGSLALMYLWKRRDVPRAYDLARQSVQLDPTAYWQSHFILSRIYDEMDDRERWFKTAGDATRYALDDWWDPATGIERTLTNIVSDWFAGHDKAELTGPATARDAAVPAAAVPAAEGPAAAAAQGAAAVASAVPPAAPAATPAQQAPLRGWYADPLARHQQRWWDGERWTEDVADGGVATRELPATAAPAYQQPAMYQPAPGPQSRRPPDGATRARPGRPRRGGRVLVAILVAAVVILVLVGVIAFVEDQRQKADWREYAGKWVLVGSHGREYIRLRTDGTYTVHLATLRGSIAEKWHVDDGRVFVPTEARYGAGEDEVHGCYFRPSGRRLICEFGSLRGTYVRR